MSGFDEKIAELKYNEEVDSTPLESLLGLTSMCQVNEKYQWMEVHTAQRREDQQYNLAAFELIEKLGGPLTGNPRCLEN